VSRRRAADNAVARQGNNHTIDSEIKQVAKNQFTQTNVEHCSADYSAIMQIDVQNQHINCPCIFRCK
jgi:hypothetical protein